MTSQTHKYGGLHDTIFHIFKAQQFYYFSTDFHVYAPNFKEVEGAYWFGPVRPSVCQSARPLHLYAVRNG